MDFQLSYTIRSRNFLRFREHLGSSPFFVGSVLLIFLDFCEFIFVMPSFVVCLVPNVACVSGLSILDYPFGFL